ncbi:phosphate acyltransferase PlsX [Alicyclobacillus sp. TC]|uniref:phosphate acyltransferase PlsX n=1 Tax=Alicyclobacillus sp. TC TaxID=2606450 RepID=UPI0019329739|nr:phosphate acyltransferase PlsX [Alicyclobacillus sp. TC]QRF23759.1 phosphate acyltransferase PlsX [Alicyclobacillus sp. TC]
MAKLVVDVMGGDLAPQAPVQAVLDAAAKEMHTEYILVGDEKKIRAVSHSFPVNVTIVHTTEQIDGTDEPVRAVRRKKNASLVIAAEMVAEGKADALLSAGNTGAIVAAGLLIIGRVPGILRPALAPVMPTFDGRGVLLLDAGATMDANEENLRQFAFMGSYYSEMILGTSRPRVGLLNVGTEAGKGNALTKATFPLLKKSNLHFVGNVEARDVLSGICDVLVCDGFAGNVVLKLAEGLGLGLASGIRSTLVSSFQTKLGALLVKPQLKQFFHRFEYSEYGGAPFLGVNGGCFKAHGSSNVRAWYVALGQAQAFVEKNLLGKLSEAFLNLEEV